MYTITARGLTRPMFTTIQGACDAWEISYEYSVDEEMRHIEFLIDANLLDNAEREIRRVREAWGTSSELERLGARVDSFRFWASESADAKLLIADLIHAVAMYGRYSDETEMALAALFDHLGISENP